MRNNAVLVTSFLQFYVAYMTLCRGHNLDRYQRTSLVFITKTFFLHLIHQISALRTQQHQFFLFYKKLQSAYYYRLIGALSSLKQFLATESPLKMMKNAFYFTLKALFVLKILFLSLLFAKTTWLER